IQEAGENGRSLLPIARLLFEPPAAGAGQLIETGFAVVLGNAPRGGDVSVLFELEQSRVERAVIDREKVAAGLFDSARNPIAVEWTHGMKSLEDHQRESALPDVLFVMVAHGERNFLLLNHRTIGAFLWESNRKEWPEFYLD